MEAFKLFQLGTAYSQSLLAYATDGRPRPFSASFAVSNKCNIRCSYCNFPNIETPDLSIEDIGIIFSRLQKIGVKRLGLLGGEPLFRRDFKDILHLAEKAGFLISLNTNLLLYEKYKNDLNAIDYFFTSLDGSPENHIKTRGKQNYQRIIDAIRDIVARGKKVTAICVVTSPRLEIADYLIDLAEKEHILIHFQPECYDSVYVSNGSPEFVATEEIRRFWLYLLERKRQGAPISSSVAYLKYISQWTDYSISSLMEPSERCAAGRGYLFVDASGYAFPCAFTKDKVTGVNMLKEDWTKTFSGQTPCTKCIVGPMLEFNMLFQKPMASITNAWNNIV